MLLQRAIVRESILTLFVLLMVSSAHGQDELVPLEFSETDADILQHGDIYSASRVVGSLQRQLKHVGMEAMKVAVPALVFRYHALEMTPSSVEHEGEIHYATAAKIIGLLSKLGDPRSKAVLIDGLKYGPMTVAGLQAIGPSVVPDLSEAMSDSRKDVRKGVLRAFRTIYESDASFFNERSMIQVRDDVTILLADEEPLVRRAAITTLGMFGDETTIPLLEAAEQDRFVVKYKDTDTFVIRDAAREAIERITKKNR